MSVVRSLDEGVRAIQAGKLEEGARLLRFALRDDTIRGELRATALTWLAETVRNHSDKLALYEQALEASPGFQLAQDQMAKLLTLPGQPRSEQPPAILDAPPPPDPIYEPPYAHNLPPPLPELPPINLPTFTATEPQPAQRLYESVGIIVGNRRGSGFFITERGLIATTRYVVGAQEHLTVELEPGQQVAGRVVRAFPEKDVALVYVEQRVSELLPFSPYSEIPANMPLVIKPYQQAPLQAHRRETGRMMAAHLFPTDVRTLPDAGGAPVFNDQGTVLGMITRNISSASPDLYGVHISAIRQCVDTFLQEMQQEPNRTYCISCGSASIAAAAGGDYCDVCGGVMPQAQNITRIYRPQMVAHYSRNPSAPCTICGAQVGFYSHRCLRCGQIGDPAQRTPGG